MGSQKTLAMVAVLLFISQLVAAAPSHENYDNASLDLNAIIYYFESSFDVLNETLIHIIDMDPESASEGSANFANMIDGMRTTLSITPEDVDSFEPLESMVNLIGEIDEDLTIMINGFQMTLRSIWNLTDYRFVIFEIGPIAENLSRADRALIEFEHGISEMEDGRSLVVDDLNGFKDTGWDINLSVEEEALGIDMKLDLLQDIKLTIDDLEDNRSSIDEVIQELMVVPINDVHRSLTAILDELSPDDTLEKDIDIMDGVTTGLSPEMGSVIQIVKGILEDSLTSIQIMYEEQTAFLSNISLLEGDEKATLSNNIIRYEICTRAIEAMNGELAVLGSIQEKMGEFDNGTISMDIDLLTDMIGNYTNRLAQIAIYEPDFGTLSAGIEDVMTGNILDVDLDGNGVLSVSEVNEIELGTDTFSSLSDINFDLDEMRNELSRLPKGYFTNLSQYLSLIDRAIETCNSFTLEHNETLSTMKELGQITRSGPEDALKLVDCYKRIAGLEALLVSLNRTVIEIDSVGIRINNTWENGLSEQLDLYSGFLSSLEHLILEPVILINLDRIDAPYDTSVFYNIVAIDIHPVNGTYFPDKRNVVLTFDSNNLTNISLVDGKVSGELIIDRTLREGTHFLNVSMISENGNTTSDSGAIYIRKLKTSFLLDDQQHNILHGTSLEINVSIEDELGRNQRFNISILPDMVQIETPVKYNAGVLPLGSNSLHLDFKGNDHFETSNTTIEIFTFQDPILLLSTNGSEIGYNDTIEIWIDPVTGNGSLKLFMNDVETSSFNVTEGTGYNISIDPYLIGNGTYLFKAFLSSSDEWTLDGWSNAIIIRVDLTIPPETDIPGVNVDENISIPDDRNETQSKGFDLVQWLIFISISTIIVALSIIFIVTSRRKKKGKNDEIDEPFHLPRIYIRSVKKPVETQTMTGEKDLKPILKRSKRPMETMKREELIDHYLDVIERSPYEIGLKKSMTPREITSKLTSKGLDPEIADRISKDFERSIYKLGTPEKGVLTRYRDDQNKVKSWFGSFLNRLGIGSENEEVLN